MEIKETKVLKLDKNKLDEALHNIMNKTLNDGLPYDDDAKSLFGEDGFNELLFNFRLYGKLFGEMFIEKIIDKIEDNKEKEN